MNNLEEMDRFLEKFNLLILNQEEIEIMNKPNTKAEIETMTKIFQNTKAKGWMASKENFIQHLKKS